MYRNISILCPVKQFNLSAFDKNVSISAFIVMCASSNKSRHCKNRLQAIIIA